ncbi:MAG: PAS domain S-box-containing protein, partial [Litorivivens sp.]
MPHRHKNMLLVKAKICDGTGLGMAILAIPAVAGSFSRITVTGILPVMYFQFFIAILLWVSVFARKRLPYWFRASFIIFILYAVALTGQLQFGLVAPGVFFVVVPTFSVILFGPRAAAGLGLLVIFSNVVVATLFVKGYLGTDLNAVEYSVSAVAWINQIFSYLLVAGMLLIAVTISQRGLANALNDARSVLTHRVALDNMYDGIITMDNQGLVATANPGAERLFGYEPGKIIGVKAEILMPAKYREAHIKGMKRFFLGKGSKLMGMGSVELEGLKKNGEVFPISLSLNDFVADGQHMVTSVIKDITVETLARKESERSSHELAQLIDTANAPIFGIDAAGRITEWNQSAVKISGFEKEQVLGRDLVRDFITEEYKASVKEVFDNALGGEETANFEFPLHTKDGSRLDVLLNASTRRDLEGNIVGVIGVGQNITAEKLARKEGERSSGELAQLIDTANAPIFGIDAAGRVTEWNQSAVKISGFEKEQVLGRDLVQDFITEEYKASVKEVFDNALRGEETANYEFPLYTKDGSRLDVLLNASTRRDLEGNIVGVIGVGQNITAENLARKQSERLSEELTLLIDTANAPIFGIDAAGRVTEWNQSAVKISGFEKEQVLGRDLVQDYITEEYKASVKEVFD